SSQVPSTVTLRLLRRRLSNCSSDSFSQGYFFRRGMGNREEVSTRGRRIVSQEDGQRQQCRASCCVQRFMGGSTDSDFPKFAPGGRRGCRCEESQHGASTRTVVPAERPATRGCLPR